MEISKEIKLFPEFGNLKYTDLPSYIPTKMEDNLITRPVGVFTEIERPISRPRNLFVTRVTSSLTINRFKIVWTLRSSGRRSKIITYLFHKWLFGQLSKEEELLRYDLDDFIRNNMIFSALRAKSIGFSMRTIRKALLVSPLLFNEPAPTLKRWNGFKTFTLEITKEVSPKNERKGKKYSGWKRHQNDQGSLGPPKEDPFYLLPIDENDVISLFLQICQDINSGKSEILINQIKVKV
jgi:hypothetical protein